MTSLERVCLSGLFSTVPIGLLAVIAGAHGWGLAMLGAWPLFCASVLVRGLLRRQP